MAPVLGSVYQVQPQYAPIPLKSRVTKESATVAPTHALLVSKMLFFAEYRPKLTSASSPSPTVSMSLEFVDRIGLNGPKKGSIGSIRLMGKCLQWAGPSSPV